MEALIQWGPEFVTGIDIIDSQHQRLFEYFSEIEQIVHTGDQEAVSGICRGLIDYAIYHNNFEESLMKQAGYPMHEAHSMVHAAFAERAKRYLTRLESGEDSMRLAREIRVDIGLWLINHIKREDMHYVACVKKHLQPNLLKRTLGKLLSS